MKTIPSLCTASLLLLCCTACGESSQVIGTIPEDGSIRVTAAEDVDARYGETLAAYFKAIDNHDYTAFEKTLYPPYKEQYTAFLKTKDSDLQKQFDALCTKFDEDGYEGWTLTDVSVSYYSKEGASGVSDGIDDFFNAYVTQGVFDEAFVQSCRDEASDIRDIRFTLLALYDGDESAVPVVNGGEVLMLITADGCYIFG